MNIVVTGAAGFIGSNVVERLLADGHQVVGIDNFDSYYALEIKRSNISCALKEQRFRLVEGDIRDDRALEHCFTSPVDAVIHLAARAGVRPSLLQPELYYDVNVMGTLRLLEMMRKQGVKKLLFASSSSVYGNQKKVPFSEDDPVDNPISPYAATKKAGELLCHTYYHLYQMDIACLRFFTVYGPRQRPEMAIHQFVRKIEEGQPLTLYGDGTTRRDYTFIADILQGIMNILHAIQGFEVVNLGESRTISLAGLVKSIEQVLGKKADLQWLPSQPGDVDQTYADIEKAKRLFHYNPQYPIERGLEEFAVWFRQHRVGATA